MGASPLGRAGLTVVKSDQRAGGRAAPPQSRAGAMHVGGSGCYSTACRTRLGAQQNASALASAVLPRHCAPPPPSPTRQARVLLLDLGQPHGAPSSLGLL